MLEIDGGGVEFFLQLFEDRRCLIDRSDQSIQLQRFD